MKTSSKILLAGLAFVLLSSFGMMIYVRANISSYSATEVYYAKGDPIEQYRDINGFEGISTAEGINVYVTQADMFEVKVIADDDVIDRLITNVSEGDLKIYFEGKVKSVSKKEVHIKMPVIDNLQASSGAGIKTEGLIKGNELEAGVSSGAWMDIKIDYKELEASSSSGANISIEGDAEEGEFDASSGANIKAGNLNVGEADTDVSSGANISLGDVKELSVDASSGGGVRYKGQPVMNDIDLSSGGNVKRSH